jgi:hypothetical protein
MSGILMKKLPIATQSVGLNIKTFLAFLMLLAAEYTCCHKLMNFLAGNSKNFN